MIGRVFRSFSGFIVLITPSILQSKRHTFIRYRDLSTHCIVSTTKFCLKGPKNTILCGSRTTVLVPAPPPGKRKDQTEVAVVLLPSFHFGEVNCYKSIGKCFFIQVSAVSPNEGRHIIA